MTQLNQVEQLEQGKSVFTLRPVDRHAIYLEPANFSVQGDGIADDTDAIQAAINYVKDNMNYGIVFIPEGTYRISRTIYVPKAVRLIGYGENRPTIVLAPSSPGYQEPVLDDKGKSKYMLWFTDRVPQPGEVVRDANAGTFYSAMSNINLKIEDGNPEAVALRTHFAQHCFIAHVDIHIGHGKAGMFDVGNEIENVRFFGGEYGIYTTKPSPGWPFMMIDTYFEGQRKAAIQSQEVGLTILRMRVKNVPTVVDTPEQYIEKLMIEDSQFENISGPALMISNEHNVNNQITLLNVDCQEVPILASFRQSGKVVEAEGSCYKVVSFQHGNQMDDVDQLAEMKTVVDLHLMKSIPISTKKGIPALPDMDNWVNLMDLGGEGDGVTDDTLVLQEAIQKYDHIYLPQGTYKVTETIKLRKETAIIGLNPISTQIVLPDNTETFAGFGSPKPLLEVPKGGRNIVYGIGLDTGARNPRAVGCKWMAGPLSYMNDVKFMGGHGTMSSDGSRVPMYNHNRTADANPDVTWDSQYWSLWVTDGGGGIFKDIWTASPYASAGLYVSDTATEGRIYVMSVEHHVRNEVKFKNVSNWRVYALQLEEEIAESWNCLPLELESCRDMFFATLYFFRTIWLVNPYPYAIKTWDVENITFSNVHNFTQVKYTITNTLFDVNSNTEVRPWQLNRLYISGQQPNNQHMNQQEDVSDAKWTGATSIGTEVAQQEQVASRNESMVKLAGGFEFADTICQDSKGNIFFADSRWKRIYKWSVEQESLSLVTDIHFKPLSLACDTEDNLLVVVEYFPPKGATINGEPEVYPKPDEAQGTSYGTWYNTGSTIKAYAIDPEHPEETMQVLKTAPMGSLKKVHKALYPANRWRDSNDFLINSVKQVEECFVAPDQRTIIPNTYDLIRANSLLEAYPGKRFYAVDEYYKRTVTFEVSQEGYLSNPVIFAERGEYHVATDSEGNVYIPDGEIYVYNDLGQLIHRVVMEERPACLLLGATDQEQLFVTTRSSFYMLRPQQWMDKN